MSGLMAEYKRDMNCNYMLVPCEDAETESSELYRVITTGKMKGLIQCQIRYKNDRPVLYYDISSKQPLSRLYESKEMEYGALKALLLSIKTVMDSMSEFFLDLTGVIMEPEYIYMDSETGEASFLLYPSYDKDSFCALSELSEYLIGRVCHADRQAVEVAYELFRISREDNYVLSDIFRKLEEPLPNKPVDTDGDEEKISIHSSDENVMKTEPGGNNEKQGSSSRIDCSDINTVPGEKKEEEKKKKQSQKKLLISVLILIPVVIAFLIVFGANGMVIAAALVIGLIACLKILSAMKREVIHTSTWQERKMEYSPISTVKEMDGNLKEQKTTSEFSDSERVTGEDYYGATMVVGSGDFEERILYCTVGSKNKEYSLKELPKTLGKIKNHAQIIVDDRTISRMHARFTEQENQVYIEDLNSTNGTFVNGNRLDANEKVLLKQGDELRFGKVDAYYG